MTLAIFLTSIAVLLFNNEWLKPRVAKKTIFPVPMELILIILSMALTKLFDAEKNWNVFLVGEIPSGLPIPTLPKLDLWKELLLDAFAIAVVSYSISVSLALLFAQKGNYGLDFNQELLALVSKMSFTVQKYFKNIKKLILLSRAQQMYLALYSRVFPCLLLWVVHLYSINSVGRHN